MKKLVSHLGPTFTKVVYLIIAFFWSFGLSLVVIRKEKLISFQFPLHS